MEEDIKKLLEIPVRRYIEDFIINLDLSDSTKNNLKRQLRKIFLDEDLLYDLKNILNENENKGIPISVIQNKIKDLKENNNGDDYNLTNVIMILQELLEERK